MVDAFGQICKNQTIKMVTEDCRVDDLLALECLTMGFEIGYGTRDVMTKENKAELEKFLHSIKFVNKLDRSHLKLIK